jgi:hypothetical protein
MAKRKRIAIGGISTECSTYSPLFQTAADFEKVQGSLLVDLVGFPFDLIRVWIAKRKYMEVILDVIFEMGSILLMGIVFFVLYVYGKLILIKIGLIDAEQVDESQKGDEPDWSMWIE